MGQRPALEQVLGPMAAHRRLHLPLPPRRLRLRSSIQHPASSLIFTDRLQIWPTERKCFRDGSSHLHCLPGWEDYLHTFALGALALDPRWYQNKLLPHYDLTKRKHHLALECGAIEIPDTQLRDHTRLWKQFRQTPPPKLPL